MQSEREQTLTRYLREWKAIAAILQLREANDSFLVKGSTRFFSKIASIFKKVLHLKDLTRLLDCIDVSFNHENGVFSKIKK